MPLAASATPAAAAEADARDESPPGTAAAQEAPPDSGRPAQPAAAERADASFEPALAASHGPLLPFSTPLSVSPDALGAASAATPGATSAVSAAAPAATAATAAAAPEALGATTSGDASGARSTPNAPAADPQPASADPAALLSDPANTRPASPAATSTTTVRAEVGGNGWTEEVGTHVVWMAHQGVTEASLRLQPEHLGPLEIRISLHDNDASVWFGASAPATRAALEQALPQLKEMFAAQGMTLSDAGVSRESARDAQYAPRPGNGPSAVAEHATPVALATPRRGLIDTYA
jgi:flagellar hook-length control protein FliK